MSPSRIGKLRNRIVVEAVTRTSDGGGGAHETWAPVATVWAAIETTDGAENMRSEATSGRISHTVIMRHHDAIAPAMRLRLGARILEIIAVYDADGRARFLTCLCREQDL